MKTLLPLITALPLLFSCAGTTADKENTSPRTTKPTGTVSIIAVGDIMLGTGYPTRETLPPNKGRELLADVNAILKDADVTFGNLEGSVLNAGPTIKNCSKCFSFRMPDYLIENLDIAGFDVVSVANNHVRDFGQPGLDNTLKVLDAHGIASAGVEQRPTAVFTKNGVRYGFAAFAPNIGTIQIRDYAGAKRIVAGLAKRSDIVIVSFHGGAEGATKMHVPRRDELYYGENRGDVHRFAHAVIDAGADVVFGHGPHVPRAVEIYKDRFIAYSLGNFATYGPFNVAGPAGIAPIVWVNLRKDGRFVDGQIISAKQIKNTATVRDPSRAAVDTIRRLTQADGFGSTISIADDGTMTRP